MKDRGDTPDPDPEKKEEGRKVPEAVVFGRERYVSALRFVTPNMHHGGKYCEGISPLSMQVLVRKTRTKIRKDA